MISMDLGQRITSILKSEWLWRPVEIGLVVFSSYELSSKYQNPLEFLPGVAAGVAFLGIEAALNQKEAIAQLAERILCEGLSSTVMKPYSEGRLKGYLGKKATAEYLRKKHAQEDEIPTQASF